jgi:hypothetical protein
VKSKRPFLVLTHPVNGGETPPTESARGASVKSKGRLPGEREGPCFACAGTGTGAEVGAGGEARSVFLPYSLSLPLGISPNRLIQLNVM